MKSIRIIVPCALMIACGLVDLGHSHLNPNIKETVAKSVAREMEGDVNVNKPVIYEVHNGHPEYPSSKMLEEVYVDKNHKVVRTAEGHNHLTGDVEKLSEFEKALKNIAEQQNLPSWLTHTFEKPSSLVKSAERYAMRILNSVNEMSPEDKLEFNKHLENVGPMLDHLFSNENDKSPEFGFKEIANRFFKELNLSEKEKLQVRREMARGGWVAPENLHFLEDIIDKNPESKHLPSSRL
ncbi:uncharacterized protein MELLADRAFT_59518 [Melampsora larici-populina 98AG31]|uniref:Secreted protein n=1 Tax=Melampsora larici-populina (strain 98AG31 / pathotype 3-4-7) TaxID=747676 RepID=F4R7S6_MELLP|nr:uncharacterized protein MELLADRAFT_59518 [Melampsora larici-populina 98AG31]EGG11733.1 secreted protein [Melampsora larici-populina 98AG31]